MKTNKFLIFWFVLLIAAAILTQCAKSGWSWSLSKAIEVTGHKLEDDNDRILLTITGKKFGKQRNEAPILLNGKELDPTHILKWRDHEIKIFMQKPFNYALVKLKNKLIPIWNPSFLPQTLSPDKTGASYPVLEKFHFVSDTVVEIQGQNFGSRFAEQMLLLSRQPENYQDLYFSLPMLENYRPLQREEILLWNDNTVQFILPQETVEGPIYLLRQDKDVLQISNNLYIPATREYRASKSVKMRLSLKLPESTAPSETYIQWPRNTLNQRWIYAESLPIERIELQAPSSKSGLAVDPPYLDFFHSSLQQEVPLNGRNRSYTDRELQLYAALLRRNLALTSQVPTWAHGVSDNLSPYSKAFALYKQILQRFNQEGTQRSWPNLQDKATQEIFLLFLDSLTRLKIPARIIAGAISSGTALDPYFWMEIYFPEFGWFQVDPLAELANKPSNNLQYWGNLSSAKFFKIAFFPLRDRWQNYNRNKIRWNLQVLDS